MDHDPYNNALGFNIAATAWKMFQRQPMRYPRRGSYHLDGAVCSPP